jgi:hypothetical protein
MLLGHEMYAMAVLRRTRLELDQHRDWYRRRGVVISAGYSTRIFADPVERLL